MPITRFPIRLFSTHAGNFNKKIKIPENMKYTMNPKFQAIGREFAKISTIIDFDEPNDYHRYHMMRIERAEEFKKFAEREKAKQMQNSDELECTCNTLESSGIDASILSDQE